MIGLKSLHRAVLPGIVVLMLTGSASQAQQTYSSPEDAASALAAAVKGKPGDILKVLGHSADDIVFSGDEVADADIRQRFISMYDQKYSIKAEANKKATLLLGPDDFPFPIPLVNTKGGWEFDTDEGRKEVLYRRIGRNELDAIQTMLAYVDAQNEYADKDRGQGGSMPSASSRRPARRTVCSGATTAIRVRSARWRPMPRKKATRPAAWGQCRITAIISAS
jgi:hypothetical protein